MRTFWIVLLGCWLGGLLLGTPLAAQKQKGKKCKDKKGADCCAASVADTAKKGSISEKVKHCRVYDGLFKLYQDTTNGNTYIEIGKDQLGKEFIYFSYTENGPAETGHFKGNFRDNKIFSLKRYFDKIEWVTQNTNYYFDPQSPLSKARDANISPAILLSQKIAAEDTLAGRILLDANPFFLSENLHQVRPSAPPGAKQSAYFMLGTLSKDKTQYARIRNYPQNTEVVVNYVYDYPEPVNYGSSAVTDARSVCVTLQHTFLEVPQNNYQPRLDDPRIGFFSTEIMDLTTKEAVAYRDLIHRWHLVKKDTTEALSEPVEPITFWIENTTPLEFRQTIKQAVLAWNEAFETAGFKNAIVVKIQPDTASWDAGDIR